MLTRQEHLAYNAVETYSFDSAKDQIQVHYRFNEKASDGKLNDSYQHGWVSNKAMFTYLRLERHKIITI